MSYAGCSWATKDRPQKKLPSGADVELRARAEHTTGTVWDVWESQGKVCSGPLQGLLLTVALVSLKPSVCPLASKRGLCLRIGLFSGIARLGGSWLVHVGQVAVRTAVGMLVWSVVPD